MDPACHRLWLWRFPWQKWLCCLNYRTMPPGSGYTCMRYMLEHNKHGACAFMQELSSRCWPGAHSTRFPSLWGIKHTVPSGEHRLSSCAPTALVLPQHGHAATQTMRLARSTAYASIYCAVDGEHGLVSASSRTQPTSPSICPAGRVPVPASAVAVPTAGGAVADPAVTNAHSNSTQCCTAFTCETDGKTCLCSGHREHIDSQDWQDTPLATSSSRICAALKRCRLPEGMISALGLAVQISSFLTAARVE